MPETIDVLCGLDIGTTHIKAVLVTEDGSVLSMAKLPTPVTSDGYGACHDPEEVRATAEQVMCLAQQNASTPARVSAVGVTSVGEEGVPLGANGDLLYPAIAWYERRQSAAEQLWSARHSDEELFTVTGLHKDLGLTIFKWLWLKDAQPEIWARIRFWLGIADYVIWRWTGYRGMSFSHASRTGLFEILAFQWKQDWAAEVLAYGTEALPQLHEAGSPVGFLRAGAVPDLFTAPEVPVVATGLDHTVGTYATGVQNTGQVLDSMGTAEALIETVSSESVRNADGSLGMDFGVGILPGTHIAIAGLASGAGVAGIFRSLGAASRAEQRQLESRAAMLPPGSDGLVYVPPRMRSNAGGALFGHKVTHEAAHVYRAVVEGWAMAACEALRVLGSQDRIRDLVCIGGGSSSSLWARVKASVLGRDIRCVTTPEIVAIGAALLAGQAVAGEEAGQGASAGWKPAASVIAPVPGWVPRYSALSDEFRRLAGLVHPDAGHHIYP